LADTALRGILRPRFRRRPSQTVPDLWIQQFGYRVERFVVCLRRATRLVRWYVFLAFTNEDAARFQFLGKTIAAFASGYVLSKFETLISTLIKNAGEHPESVPWERVGLFGSSFLLAAIVVFVSRAYSDQAAFVGP